MMALDLPRLALDWLYMPVFAVTFLITVVLVAAWRAL